MDKKEEKASRRALAENQRRIREGAARTTSLEGRFWASPPGHARKAKQDGRRYFQVEIPIDYTYQTTRAKVTADVKTKTKKQEGHGAVLTAIEEEGWELFQAGFVFKETGQVSRDKFLSSGQQVKTTGSTWGVYLFWVTAEPANTEKPWLQWTEEPKPMGAFTPTPPILPR